MTLRVRRVVHVLPARLLLLLQITLMLGGSVGRYICHYHKNLTLKLAISKIKHVMVIEIRMENIFQINWKYLRQQEKKTRISNCYLII